MKKFTIFLTSLLVALSILPASAGNDRIISVGELPARARQFIDTHFKGMEVSYVRVEEEWFDKEYKVLFVNGAKAEFVKNGDWKEVDCRYQGEVPAELVPVGIADYLRQNFREQRVVGIEQDRHGYDVRLDNGLDLEFDRQGRLVDIDD